MVGGKQKFVAQRLSLMGPCEGLGAWLLVLWVTAIRLLGGQGRSSSPAVSWGERGLSQVKVLYWPAQTYLMRTLLDLGTGKWFYVVRS